MRSNGLRAMNLEPGDELLDVKYCKAGDEIILVTEKGQAARFNVGLLRTASRVSGGVRGVKLGSGDKLASMDVVVPAAQLLVVAQNGYGKRTPLSAYPTKGRGIGGVRTLKATPRTGPVAAARVVTGSEELLLISTGGIVIRMALDTITEHTGRATSGVTVMSLRQGDRLAAIELLEPSANGDDETDPDAVSSDVTILSEEEANEMLGSGEAAEDEEGEDDDAEIEEDDEGEEDDSDEEE